MESIQKSLFTQPPIEKGAVGPAKIEEAGAPQVADSTQITGSQAVQEIKPAAVAMASEVPDTVEGKALTLLKDEPHYWAGALPELLKKEDKLSANGRDFAMVAMAAQDSSLAPDISAYFARKHLAQGIFNEVGYDFTHLHNCGSSPGQNKAVAGEVNRCVDFVLGEMKSLGLPAEQVMQTAASIATLVSAQPGLLQEMSDADKVKLGGLFRKTITGELNMADYYKTEITTALADGTATLAASSPGTYSMDWFFDFLKDRGLNSTYLDLAPRLGRPIPDDIMNERQATMKDSVTKMVNENLFFRNERWFTANLDLLHGAFDARGDDRGRIQFADSLLKVAVSKGLKAAIEKHLKGDRNVPEASPEFIIIAGEQKFVPGQRAEAPAAPYEPQGPADMKQALAGFAEIENHDDFEEKAGDQAILALADPAHREEARQLWIQKIGANMFLGHFLAGGALDRLNEISARFPEKSTQARAELIEAIDGAIKNGGKFKKDPVYGMGDPSEDLIFMIEKPYFSREEKLRLMSHSLELNRRLETEDSRIHKRGIIYGSLIGNLGETPAGSMPEADRASIMDTLAKDSAEMETRFDNRHHWYLKWLEDEAQR